MSKSQLAQEAREYKTIPNMHRYRRPDGVLVATAVLSPDDPGLDSSREDARVRAGMVKGSMGLLLALRAAHG